MLPLPSMLPVTQGSDKLRTAQGFLALGITRYLEPKTRNPKSGWSGNSLLNKILNPKEWSQTCIVRALPQTSTVEPGTVSFHRNPEALRTQILQVFGQKGHII